MLTVRGDEERGEAGEELGEAGEGRSSGSLPASTANSARKKRLVEELVDLGERKRLRGVIAGAIGPGW